jgi:hypothetical protein
MALLDPDVHETGHGLKIHANHAVQHQSLLLRQPAAAYLPLFQVRTLRQRLGPLGPGKPIEHLRCRHRSVPTPQNPAADPSAANAEQRRGNRSSADASLYNIHNLNACPLPLLAKSTSRLFQITLNQDKTKVVMDALSGFDDV